MKSGRFFDKFISYLTATQYRSVFFAAVVIAAICTVVSVWAGAVMLQIAMGFLCLAIICSLVDSMQARVAFNRQIYAMQEAHYKKYLDAGTENPDAVPMAFSPEEHRYIKRQKNNYVFIIVFKVALLVIIIASFFA